jgi:AraC-like DNA-binding protein
MVCLDEGGRGRRAIRLIAAPARLAPWVEHFWIQAATRAGKRLWRVVPDASSHIILSVEREPRCHMVGSRAVYHDVDTAGRRVTLGARLRPGTAIHLARCSADALTGGSFPLEDVFGWSGRTLGARMAEGTPEEALRHLGRFLSAQLAACEPEVHFVAALRSARSVAMLAAMLSVSLRTVRSRALKIAGLPPKRLLRIGRLHRALRYAAMPGAWSDIASCAGFADQAHMVREFGSLLGDSPQAWRNRSAADSFNTPPVCCATLRS